MSNNNFFIAINKPLNWTSSDVVVKCRNLVSKALNEKVKAGHMGTLDPGATGLLLVGINKANRLFDYLLLKKKTYIGTLTFGKSTDTQDSYGEVISESELPNINAIREHLNDFIGEITQIPPKYSAIKINGQKAYDMARKNKDFTVPERKVTIYNLKENNISLNGDKVESIELVVKCSSGTYIRTLFTDIAKSLNADGYMSKLNRIELASIKLDDSITIEKLSENPLSKKIEMIDVIKNIMPTYELSDLEYKLVAQGNKIKIDNKQDDFIALTYKNELKFIGKNVLGEVKSNTNLE